MAQKYCNALQKLVNFVVFRTWRQRSEHVLILLVCFECRRHDGKNILNALIQFSCC